MNTIKCIIIDDEIKAINVLELFCSKTPNVKLLHSFQNPIEALEYLKTYAVDLIFLDIQMPEISGIEFLNINKNPARVIITTAYEKYALDGHKYGALDYLVKPIAYESFLKSINRFENILIKDVELEEEDEFFTFSTGIRKALQKIYFKEIIYVEAQLNYSNIYTEEETFKLHISLKELEQKFDDRFIRIHKSYIVAKKSIKKLENGGVSLFYNNTFLQVGTTHKDELVNFLISSKI